MHHAGIASAAVAVVVAMRHSWRYSSDRGETLSTSCDSSFKDPHPTFSAYRWSCRTVLSRSSTLTSDFICILVAPLLCADLASEPPENVRIIIRTLQSGPSLKWPVIPCLDLAPLQSKEESYMSSSSIHTV